MQNEQFLIIKCERSPGLQKLCSMSLSLKLVFSAYSKHFSSATTMSRKSQNFTVFYLVNSLDLTTKLAETISKKVIFEDKDNPEFSSENCIYQTLRHFQLPSLSFCIQCKELEPPSSHRQSPHFLNSWVKEATKLSQLYYDLF